MYLSPVQNEVKRLYNQLVQRKTALQQSLNEISGQSVGKQLQVNHRNVQVNLASDYRVLGISCVSKTHPLASVSGVEVVVQMRTINVDLRTRSSQTS